MDRFLIVYATREGQTEKIAQRIVEHLRKAGAVATAHNAREPLADTDYNVVVYGGSMHAGGIEAELLTFMREQHERIAPDRTSFFLVLLSAATRDPAKRERALADARHKVDSQLPLTFDKIELIAGALVYSKYRWPMKWIMKRIAKEAGGDTDTSRDYEYTDWQQVEQYASSLLAP